MLRSIAIALLLTSAVGAQTRVPVVLELFTSEGCSSCPAADSLLAELEHKQPFPNVDLIVLSEHVDYWNSLGWKDPYSSSAFSQRQRSYAEMMRADDVYTPQLVIDGRFSTVGSNRPNVLKAISESAQTPKQELQLTFVRQGDTLMVEAASAEQGDIWLAVTEAKDISRVEHGENSGRTLQHVGVVRSLTKLSGGQAQIKLNRNWQSDLRLVAFVQNGNSGRILQAVQKKI